MVAGSPTADRMNALRAGLMSALSETFGDHVTDFEVTEMRDEPTPWLGMTFTLYEYFPIGFVYDRGRFGFSIQYTRGVPIKLPQHTSRDIEGDEKLVELVQALRKAVRLRIPPAYLESIGA